MQVFEMKIHIRKSVLKVEKRIAYYRYIENKNQEKK